MMVVLKIFRLVFDGSHHDRWIVSYLIHEYLDRILSSDSIISYLANIGLNNESNFVIR